MGVLPKDDSMRTIEELSAELEKENKQKCKVEEQNQCAPPETQEEKNERLPRVLMAYANSIKFMNKRGNYPVDSDFHRILLLATDRIKHLEQRVLELEGERKCPKEKCANYLPEPDDCLYGHDGNCEYCSRNPTNNDHINIKE